MTIPNTRKFVFVFAALNATLLMSETALAGVPVPVPLAGALGPLGLAAAGVGYVGYRIIKHYRDR
ncbi:MAG: hypothetical protein K8F25_07115 [Fimbriimonadaceae bacterium]|nr:hypothetical protein [Alphaproteobacteria bacterium]